MTSQDTSVVEFPIASTRLRSLNLKKHISTLYTQLTEEKKADLILTPNDSLQYVPNISNQQNKL